jgi:hypothetical protein
VIIVDQGVDGAHLLRWRARLRPTLHIHRPLGSTSRPRWARCRA